MPDANNISAPPLYYLQSQVDNSNWVLTVTTSDDFKQITSAGVRIKRKTLDESQLWAIENDERGGSAGLLLRNPFAGSSRDSRGLYLRAGGAQGDGPVTVQTYDDGDAEFVWRRENAGDWGCFNKLNDWEQKLEIKGDGPYDQNADICCYEYDGGSPHEQWKLISYAPSFSDVDIEYSNDRTEYKTPYAASVQVFDNSSGATPADYTATLTTTTTSSYTHSVSDSTASMLGWAAKFGAKFSIKQVFEVSGEGTISGSTTETHTVGEQDTITKSIAATASVKVTVAPGRKYQVKLMVEECVLTRDYTATLTRALSDGTQQSFTIAGTYTYKGAFKHETVLEDITTSAAPVTLSSVPVTRDVGVDSVTKSIQF